MHPHTADEHESFLSPDHYVMVRTLVSLFDDGINREGEVMSVPFGPPPVIPANLRGISAPKPSLFRLLGYEPFLSATVNADLDNPVQDAEIILDLGQGARSLSPYMSGPAWDWSSVDPADPLRPLLDAGVYIQLETKLVSRTPRTIIPQPPIFVAQGPFRKTAGAGLSMEVAWPGGHQAKDIALMFVRTSAQVAVPTALAGFALIPGTVQTTGTAGSATAVRLAIYWCRATSNAMAPPVIPNPGDHVFARILVWRGCIETGEPFDVAPAGSVQATASQGVGFPSLTLVNPDCVVIHAVAGATNTRDPQVSGYADPTIAAWRERSDTWHTLGTGGGFGVADGIKVVGGSTGATGSGTAVLATASTQVRYSIALRPPPIRVVMDNPDTVPWRPFFSGRIDSVDPVAGQPGHLTLRCRDMYSDALDAWIVPLVGQTVVVMDTDDVQTLLSNLYAKRKASSIGGLFATIGDPEMIVPEYAQNPQSCLLAMRQVALQNGWDLRPRWGTSPYGENQLVLTYYEPDRSLSNLSALIHPSRYFSIGEMPKNRSEVRNHWRVQPAESIVPLEFQDLNSQVKYGYKFAAISEDATGLVRTPEQGEILGAALLSDTKEPKVGAVIESPFYPWIEINDTLQLWPNAIQHDQLLYVAVSGYGHVLPQQGVATTTIRTRTLPAAASLEWRQRAAAPKRHYVSTALPTGVAVDGARWYQVRAI